MSFCFLSCETGRNLQALNCVERLRPCVLIAKSFDFVSETQRIIRVGRKRVDLSGSGQRVAQNSYHRWRERAQTVECCGLHEWLLLPSYRGQEEPILPTTTERHNLVELLAEDVSNEHTKNCVGSNFLDRGYQSR